MNIKSTCLCLYNVIRVVVTVCIILHSGCSQAEPPIPPLVATNRLILKGAELTVDDAEQLEKEVSSNPNAFSKRIMLLGYYDFNGYKFKPGSKERDLKLKHIKWVVENYPDSEAAGRPIVTVNPEVDRPG